VSDLNVTFNEFEQFALNRMFEWEATGNGYLVEQTTKVRKLVHWNADVLLNDLQPNTIGLALYDNPVGQLAWIAEKYYSCECHAVCAMILVLTNALPGSDPRALSGSIPSSLNNNTILSVTSLYYLTDSFLSSAYVYAQNPNGFTAPYTKAKTDAPMLYTATKYNILFWPEVLVEKVGNLVQYHGEFQNLLLYVWCVSIAVHRA
jgi:hypothetical protein